MDETSFSSFLVFLVILLLVDRVLLFLKFMKLVGGLLLLGCCSFALLMGLRLCRLRLAKISFLLLLF